MFLGKITSDIVNGRGVFDPIHVEGEKVLITGRVPLATSMDLPLRLNSMTGRTAKYAFRYSGYEPCLPEEGVVREYKGISPLDRSKYILKMRGAITES